MIKWCSLGPKQREAANPWRHRFGVVWQWRKLRTCILRRIALGKEAETGLSGVDHRIAQARFGLRHLLILFGGWHKILRWR